MAEHGIQWLQRVLLRVDAMVEEAEGQHITNQAMLDYPKLASLAMEIAELLDVVASLMRANQNIEFWAF